MLLRSVQIISRPDSQSKFQMGAIHSTKISGNFDLRTGWIGLVQPERFRKNYEKMGWTGRIEMDSSI